MKKFVGYLIAGNFYRFEAYKITDFYGRGYFVAEPVGAGVTRYAETISELKTILEKDVWKLNKIWTR